MITNDQVLKIADLARLELTPKEAAEYAAQMSAILEHFKSLSAVNTEGIEPMTTPTEIESYLRDDEVGDVLGAEKALSNAPERVGNLFKVPPVVGES